MKMQIRINGTAPAWPVMLEQQHTFYDIGNSESMGSASYSIMGMNDKNLSNWEILIDAGHNTVPYLLKHGNKIPNAIVLTHAHPDHILGVDWIVQSHRFGENTEHKYPIYCTQGVWEMLMISYGHIREFVEHKVLPYGIQVNIEEADSLTITTFPVFHGNGARGASMIFIEDSEKESKSALFTGDMLCPLLRRKDYELISKSALVFIDTNNRFPDPYSNHMSFTPFMPESSEIARLLKKWFQETDVESLIKAHTDSDSKINLDYFNEFISDCRYIGELPHSILDFCKLCPIPYLLLIHYFGIYDKIYYNQDLLGRDQLKIWAHENARKFGLDTVSFEVPEVGRIINL